MAAISVEGSLDRHFLVAPGQVIQGQIDIHNTLDEPAWVRVEVMDHQVNAAGQPHYPPAPSHDRSLARYIQLMAPEQTLGPRASGRIEFEVKLPTLTERPELAGAYWAVVMVKQQAVEEVMEAPRLGQWTIQERFQTAVRITTELTTHGRSQWALTSPMLKLHPKPVFELTVANQAERLVDVQLIGELFSAEGQSLGITELGRLQVYPGHQRRLEWAIHELLNIADGEVDGEVGGHPKTHNYQAIVIAAPTARMIQQDPVGARFELRWEEGKGHVPNHAPSAGDD